MYHDLFQVKMTTNFPAAETQILLSELSGLPITKF